MSMEPRTTALNSAVLLLLVHWTAAFSPPACIRCDRTAPHDWDAACRSWPACVACLTRVLVRRSRLPGSTGAARGPLALARSHARAPRPAAWSMQEEGKAEDIDEKLQDIGSETKSRLDAAINDPKVMEEMTQKAAAEAAQKRVDELKARAMQPPAPRPQAMKTEESVAPSFMQQTAAEAEKKAEQAAQEQAAKMEARRLRIEEEGGNEIDPRGFIVPKVGDIVLCPGKWANEDMVALVEGTQFVDARMSWNVDVIELNQVGPDLYGKQYSAWKQPIKRWYDVSEIRPARVVDYDESQDAWRVENARNYINTPVVVNETARDEGLEEYKTLKQKILVNTAVIGLAGSGGLALWDTSYASSFALGSVSAIAYISLLAGSVETVRPGGASNAGLPLLSPRFLAPLALFAGLYVKFQYFSPYEDDGVTSTGSLPSVPTEEIFAAALGFLSYKLPLLYESTKEIAASLDDAGEGLESGIGNGYKIWQGRTKDRFKEARERESNPATAWNPFTQIRLRVEKQYEENENLPFRNVNPDGSRKQLGSKADPDERQGGK